MEKIKLAAQKRIVVGHKVKKLRREGTLPANLYGKNLKSVALQLPQKEFMAIFSKVGETGLVELSFDGEIKPVLIHNVQVHPVTNEPLHVDFFKVDLKEKVTTKVPLIIVGEATAVKDKIGVLLTILSTVEVEALPADLPDKIEVDVSKLAAVGNSIKIGELKIDSKKIKILAASNLEIVKVAPLVSKEAEKLAKEEAEKAAAAAASAIPTEAAGEVKAEEAQTSKTIPTGKPETPPPAESKQS